MASQASQVFHIAICYYGLVQTLRRKSCVLKYTPWPSRVGLGDVDLGLTGSPIGEELGYKEAA